MVLGFWASCIAIGQWLAPSAGGVAVAASPRHAAPAEHTGSSLPHPGDVNGCELMSVVALQTPDLIAAATGNPPANVIDVTHPSVSILLGSGPIPVGHAGIETVEAVVVRLTGPEGSCDVVAALLSEAEAGVLLPLCSVTALQEFDPSFLGPFPQPGAPAAWEDPIGSLDPATDEEPCLGIICKSSTGGLAGWSPCDDPVMRVARALYRSCAQDALRMFGLAVAAALAGFADCLLAGAPVGGVLVGRAVRWLLQAATGGWGLVALVAICAGLLAAGLAVAQSLYTSAWNGCWLQYQLTFLQQHQAVCGGLDADLEVPMPCTWCDHPCGSA